MNPSIRPVFTFLAMLALLSAVPDALLLRTHGTAGGLYMAFFMWSPGFAALITGAIHRLDVRALGWSRQSVLHISYGYLLPFLYIVPVYVATWLLIPGSFNPSPFLANAAKTVGFPEWPRLAALGLDIPLLLTFGVFSRFSNTLGEELGWRGFLLPQLSESFGFTTGCSLTGIIWALWHYPLLFAFGFFQRSNAFLKIGCFTMMVIGLSFVIGWLRYQTGSLWSCVLLHATHNTLLQTILDPLTAPAGKAAYVTTEFGGGLALTVAVTGFFLWRRQKKVTLK